MPTIYLDRAGVSLYDAQYSAASDAAQPISGTVIKRVIASLLRFKDTCADFGVPEHQIRFLATEATRTATNSDQFRAEIKQATGWEVEMLPKEEEGRIGAMGVASSYPTVKGLVMDLGGGSTQLAWLVSKGDGEVSMPSSGSVSMPYGAAALSRRLTSEDHTKLKTEVTRALQDAVVRLGLPEELRQQMQHEKGLDLYLSGGGFRGWGFVLMSEHPIQPYPIPIINGFRTTREDFHNVNKVQIAVQEAQNDKAASENIFRVSDRRASQVPAVAFLVSCLADALPAINNVRFCQGGVREGAIFSQLSPEVRAQHPLVIASSSAAPRSADKLLELLDAALPKKLNAPHKLPSVLTRDILRVVINAMYTHAAIYKDLRAASALRYTTTGELAAVHGVSHTERATLALALCERWGGRGALAPSDADFYDRLVALVVMDNEYLAWWCLFVGRVAALLGELYPAGLVRKDHGTLFTAKFSGDDEAVVELVMERGEGQPGDVLVGDSVLKALKKLDRCRKKKNWYGGKGFKSYVGARLNGKALDFDTTARDEGED